MANTVILTGYLGRDPEKNSKNGNTATRVSLATTERYKNKEGKKVEITDWHTIVFFNKLGEIAAEHLTKGSLITVTGKLKTTSYEKDGATHYSTSVVVRDLEMLGGKRTSDTAEAPPMNGEIPEEPLDSEIPF